ncbi:fibronectin type III domain-containing protein [Patescibacteria group bacterium]|nr:fibronectin type III domain-containing protein [Patescibacteria group bacterium]
MKKRNFLKAGLITLAVGGILAIPLNNNFTYGYGESSVLPGSTTDTPRGQNTNPQPAKPLLFEPGHALLPRAIGNGQVRLNWVKSDKSSWYTIGYGLQPGRYIYGVSNTGDTDNFTIGYLVPGRRYYFAVRGNNNGRPGPWSQEWSVVANGGNNTITATVNRTNPINAYNLPANNGAKVNIPTPLPTAVVSVPSNSQPTAAPVVEQQNNIPATVPQPVTQVPAQKGFFENIGGFIGGLFGL